MKRTVLFALAASATLASAAFAQPSALIRRTDAPLMYDIGRADYDPDSCSYLLRGAVRLTQADQELRADRITIFVTKLAGGQCGSEFTRVVAEGDVFYVTPMLRVRGGHAVYDPAADSIEVTQRVTAVSADGDAVTEGPRLLIRVSTGALSMEATPDQRVRGVLLPPQRQGSPEPR